MLKKCSFLPFWFFGFILYSLLLSCDNEILLEESEWEFRIGLSYEGFMKLKDNYHQKSKGRDDLYLEIFDGNQFILDDYIHNITALEGSSPKIRIKSKPDYTAISLSSNFQSLDLDCYQGYASASMASKKEWRSKKSEYKEIFNSGHKFLDALNDEKLEDAGVYLAKFNKQLQESPLGKQEFFTKVFADQNLFFIPIQRNSKFRWEKKHAWFKNGKVESVLGVTFDKDSEGKNRMRYELEVEPSNKHMFKKSDKVMNHFCDLLAGFKLDKKDFSAESSVAKSVYLEKLKMVWPKLAAASRM